MIIVNSSSVDPTTSGLFAPTPDAIDSGVVVVSRSPSTRGPHGRPSSSSERIPDSRAPPRSLTVCCSPISASGSTDANPSRVAGTPASSASCAAMFSARASETHSGAVQADGDGDAAQRAPSKCDDAPRAQNCSESCALRLIGWSECRRTAPRAGTETRIACVHRPERTLPLTLALCRRSSDAQRGQCGGAEQSREHASLRAGRPGEPCRGAAAFGPGRLNRDTSLVSSPRRHLGVVL